MTTDDATHGSQQLSLFHAYYDEYCYLPVHLYEAETGKLITTILRPGRRNPWPRGRGDFSDAFWIISSWP